MRVNLILFAIIAAVLTAGFIWPDSQTGGLYPVPKVKIFVPSKPGGTTDATARAFARSLERHTGAKAVVINQTAGGGTVAVSSVADAKGDGGTLLVFHAMLHVSHGTGRMAVGASDLTPLATVSRATDVYVVRAGTPFNTLEELFSHAQQQELLIASQMGGTTQLKASALAAAAAERHGRLRPVAVGGMVKRLTALLGGQVDVSIVDLKTARQYFDAGSIKPLAVISNRRDPFEPGWPTAQEQDVNIDLAQVGEIYAPGEMSAHTIGVMDTLLADVLQDAELINELARVKQSPEYRQAADATEFIRAEEARVRDMLEAGF